MHKSLIRKELIEASAVAALPTVVYLIIIGVENHNFHYLEDYYISDQWATLFTRDIYPLGLVVPTFFAGILGLVQTVSESVRGTWGYLLHLPPARRQVIQAKLVCGLATYLACSGLFLAACVLLALRRQTIIRPLEWWMISPIAQCIVSGVLIYLGAFLTGLRPARWYGSRLLPLVGVTALWGVLLFMPNWWVYGILSLLLLCAILIAMIFHVAMTRDYV
jgi:hypothetical protein